MKIKKLFAVPGFAWASLPLNGIFNPEDGFVGSDRQEKFLTRETAENEKSGNRSQCYGSRL